MGFYATTPLPEVAVLPCRKTDLPLKKSRLGFFPSSRSRAGFFALHPVKSRWEIETTPTIIVLGHVEWLSNDPIGISGGLNQYVFCGDNPVNFVDPSGRIWVQVAGTLIGAGANYVHNFSAYTHSQISGWQYTQSVLFGAGAGFVSTVVPGVGGILAGGALAGVNNAYNQSLTSQSGIDLNQSKDAALVGLGSGIIGYVGQAAFGELGSSILYDPNGGIGEIAGSAPYNFGDIGGAIGLAGGTLLGDNALPSIFSSKPSKKCP